VALGEQRQSKTKKESQPRKHLRFHSGQAKEARKKKKVFVDIVINIFFRSLFVLSLFRVFRDKALGLSELLSQILVQKAIHPS